MSPVVVAFPDCFTRRWAYRVTNTKLAGPTMFSRGDTTYINQRGEGDG